MTLAMSMEITLMLNSALFLEPLPVWTILIWENSTVALPPAHSIKKSALLNSLWLNQMEHIA